MTSNLKLIIIFNIRDVDFNFQMKYDEKCNNPKRR